jgi:hypothetical protein
MKRIEADIVGAHNEVTYNLVDRNQLKVLLDQSELFLNNVEPLFIGFSTANRQRLAHFIFPQGILYADGKLRTPKKALMFEFIEAIESKNLDEFEKVSAQGINSGLAKLASELHDVISANRSLCSLLGYVLTN